MLHKLGMTLVSPGALAQTIRASASGGKSVGIGGWSTASVAILVRRGHADFDAGDIEGGLAEQDVRWSVEVGGG